MIIRSICCAPRPPTNPLFPFKSRRSRCCCIRIVHRATIVAPGGIAMRIRYAFALLASLVMLGSGAVYAEIMLGGPASKALQQQGTILTAQTGTAAPAPSGEAQQPAARSRIGGTVTPTHAGNAHVNFACTSAACGCQGAADCFDLGSRNLCDAKGMSCTGGNCT